MSRLDRVKTPTLVLWGKDDRLFPLAYGEAYHRAIPGSRLVTLERCGHLPHIEAPDRFADAVLDFLKA
jgi:pimeloyl-ACP methyl ester carboxylesterase